MKAPVVLALAFVAGVTGVGSLALFVVLEDFDTYTARGLTLLLTAFILGGAGTALLLSHRDAIEAWVHEDNDEGEDAP